MKRLLACITAALLAGCATTPAGPVEYGPEPEGQGARAAILQYLRVTLKDPDSLKDLVIAHPTRDCYARGLVYGGGSVCGHKVCVSYNAKNSFGAYAGKSVLVFWFQGNTPTGGVFPNAGACPSYIDPAYAWKAAEAPGPSGQDCTPEAQARLKERGLTKEAIAEICGGI